MYFKNNNLFQFIGLTYILYSNIVDIVFYYYWNFESRLYFKYTLHPNHILLLIKFMTFMCFVHMPQYDHLPLQFSFYHYVNALALQMNRLGQSNQKKKKCLYIVLKCLVLIWIQIKICRGLNYLIYWRKKRSCIDQFTYQN